MVELLDTVVADAAVGCAGRPKYLARAAVLVVYRPAVDQDLLPDNDFGVILMGDKGGVQPFVFGDARLNAVAGMQAAGQNARIRDGCFDAGKNRHRDKQVEDNGGPSGHYLQIVFEPTSEPEGCAYMNTENRISGMENIENVKASHQ